jgi:hypothetical protein
VLWRFGFSKLYGSKSTVRALIIFLAARIWFRWGSTSSVIGHCRLHGLGVSDLLCVGQEDDIEAWRGLVAHLVEGPG